MKKITTLIISSTALSLLGATFYIAANAQHAPNPQTPTPHTKPQPKNSTITPTIDSNGIYHFEAAAGDIVSVTTQQGTGIDARRCYPDFFSDPRITLWGDTIAIPTPGTNRTLLQLQANGNYKYQIQQEQQSLSDLGIGSDNAASESSPDTSSIACTVTLESAQHYEQLWASANQLYPQPDQQTQALDLYQQVIALEPPYPEPYQRYLDISLTVYMQAANIDPQDLDATGPMFLEIPETQRQPLVTSMNQLAQIYDTNPSWQRDQWDHPDFLQEYAAHIQTGTVSEKLRSLWGTD